MDGILVIDKPAGMTSHDVVDQVRRRLGTRKVGHAGTLDPDATGILIVGVGKATRLLSYAQDTPKRYRAAARFGVTTSTQDASGAVLETKDVALSTEDVAIGLKGFLGDIEQIPPMVSAVKIGGERLYKKALRGEEVERPPRRVTVYELDLVDYDDKDLATIDVRCSAGTYVRTLIHDLGRELGPGAHMHSLRRTEAGGFGLDDAVQLDDIDQGKLRSILDAVRELPRLDVDAESEMLVQNGRPIPAPNDGAEARYAIVRDDRLLAVYEKRDDRLVADRVVPR